VQAAAGPSSTLATLQVHRSGHGLVTIGFDVTEPEPPFDHLRIHRVQGSSGDALFTLWTRIDGRVWVLPSAARTRIEMQLLSERIDEIGSFWDLRMPGEIASLIADGLLRLIDLDENAREAIAEEIDARPEATPGGGS
jgi:hypothetical protein